MMPDSNEQPDTKSPVPADTAAAKPAQMSDAPARGGQGLAALALIAALGGAAGSGYVWYQWRQDNQAIDNRLRAAFADEMKTLESRLSAQQSAADALTGQADAQRKDAQGLHDSINTLQIAIAGVQGDLATLKGEIAIQRGGVDIQKTDTQNLITQVRALQTDIQNLQGQAQSLNTGLETTQAYKSLIQALQDQTQNLTTNLQTLREQSKDAAQQQQKRLAEIDNRVENLQLTQRNLLTTLDNVRAIAARGGDVNAFPLSEVEYLLRMADDKLKLQRDAAGALEALQVANMRLAMIDESVFLGVRTMVDEHLVALRGAVVSVPDRTSLARRIVELEKRLETLPLRADAELAHLKDKVKPKSGAEIPAQADESWWERAGNVVLAQLKDIVVIRRERSRGLPLVAPTEEYFLVQNLRLELEVMRLALLTGDTTSYQQSDELARQWLETYFDTNDKQVAEVLAELKALHSAAVNPTVPDLTNTLRAFRDVMERREPVRSLAPSAGATREATQ